MNNKRLLSALAAYAAIAVMAGFTLDGLLRNAVWVLMGGLALKTYVAHRAGWSQAVDEKHGEEDPEASAGEDEDS